MSKIEIRGLEFHNPRMWRWASVERALDLMEPLGLNALIFHQNDLIDQLVSPRAFFDNELMWKRWPVRLHTIDNNRHYIRKVIQAAQKRGIGFYLEVKEIYYPEGLLDIFPQLRKADGAVCATDPFWWEFLDAKVRELLEAIPDLAGIVVSPATRESKVSISTTTCTCPNCRKAEPLQWYYKLLDTMYRPLAEKGKKLILRDFSYTASDQNTAIDAASLCSKEIIIALKNTPHDFYPTFPDNPRIGQTNGHPQWVEFDTWGQFFGVGFFPCSVIEDMQERLKYSCQNGVTGVWFRTDWEGMTDACSFNSFNLLNLFGGALLARNPELDLDEVYRAWAAHGLLSSLKLESNMEQPSVPTAADAWRKLKAFMTASWSVMEKSVFVRGHVFHEDMMFPISLKFAFDMMTRIHGRDDWEPGASKRIEPTDDNLKVVFAEKDLALQEVQKLPELLQVETLGLPAAVVAETQEMLDLYQHYVRGFNYVAKVCFLAKKALTTGRSEDRQAAEEFLRILDDYRRETERRLTGTTYPHYVYWLFDVERLEMLITDIRQQLTAIS